MNPLSVIIPTLDEELHLEACLRALEGLSADVWVVDSGSRDRTPAIARSFETAGVHLVEHAYEGPAEQKNWALEHLPLAGEWVLFLDADERVSPALARSIRAALDSDPVPDGFRIGRRIYYEGQWIRHGGWYPSWNLRLLRRGRGRYECRRVHEHVVVEGEVGTLKGDLIHEDLRGLEHQIAKHLRYAKAEAQEALRLLEGSRDDYARLFSRDPLARRRWLKTRILYRVPCRPVVYFAYAYLLRLGFLDGRKGLRFHLLQALYRHFDALFLREAKRERARS
jgi:glycosyltransferase involved in cell wall biosynthesis